MSKRRIKDIQMYYEQEGTGPDLVFISGLSVDHAMWDVSRFSDAFRVLTFDNRGVGQTDIPDGPYSLEMLADDTIALCKDLGIEKAHFVGHSMGGHIAQIIGAQYPEMVHSLTIACSEQQLSTVSYLSTKVQVDLRQRNVPLLTLFECYLPLMFSLSFLEDRMRLVKYIAKTLINPPPQSDKGYILQVEALQKHDTRHLLADIVSPTLIIGCTDDLLTPYKHSEYLRDHIAHAKLVTIPQCGHLPFVEQPDLFFTAIRSFLESHPQNISI